MRPDKKKLQQLTQEKFDLLEKLGATERKVTEQNEARPLPSRPRRTLAAGDLSGTRRGEHSHMLGCAGVFES